MCTGWISMIPPAIDIAVNIGIVVVWLDVAVTAVAVVDVNVAVAAPAVGSAANVQCFCRNCYCC